MPGNTKKCPSYLFLFIPTNCPKPKDIHLTIMYVKEKHFRNWNQQMYGIFAEMIILLSK